MSEVQVVVLAKNIYLPQAGEGEAVKFFKGEVAMVPQADVEAIMARDEAAGLDPRLTVVEAPKRRGRPPKASLDDAGVSDGD